MIVRFFEITLHYAAVSSGWVNNRKSVYEEECCLGKRCAQVLVDDLCKLTQALDLLFLLLSKCNAYTYDVPLLMCELSV